MTKNNFLKTLALSAVLFLGTALQAQVKVGDNPTTINANSIFEMESTSKGMLLPRLALTNTTATSPLAAHVAGMTVYNSATAGDVTPGFYYNDGAKWVRIMGAPTGSTGAQNTTAGTLMTITNGAGATMTAMTVAVDTSAMKSFISQAVQNGAITGKNTTAGSLITVTNGAGATLTAMTLAVDTTAMKSFIANSVNSSPIKDSLNTVINNAIANSTADTSNDSWFESGANTVDTTGYVRIGMKAPQYDTNVHIKLVSSGEYSLVPGWTGGFFSTNYGYSITFGYYNGSSAGEPRFATERARGTATAPLPVQNGDLTGAIQFSGRTSAGKGRATAGIHSGVEGTPAADANPGFMAFSTTDSLSYAYVERMRITTTGNVGIGTTTPTAKLQVTSASGSAAIFTAITGFVTDIISNGAVGSNNGESITAGTNASDMSFQVRSGFSAPYFAVRGDGNVGIGTLSPTSKLAVVGLPVFADNTAAASLSVGDFYRTATGQVMVKY